MRRFLLALALPLLTVSSAFSQPTKQTPPTAQVCIPVAQAAKIADSLTVLPTVRREAAAWQQSSSFYRQAADSFRVADSGHYQAFLNVRGALQDERLLTANETAKVEAWRKTARRRGLLNYLLAAVVAGAGYVILKP